ncbi:DUF7848 domain-containing protein [Streptomyces alkaliterrae]|uniref:DUF7848 domain-containing protein n=1 Tax=Streptomyces alkaliterrae TaxID=2213162 RepID=UPI002B2164B0|nr:hypothetical protein [Streptomyces alkaliterrae]
MSAAAPEPDGGDTIADRVERLSLAVRDHLERRTTNVPRAVYRFREYRVEPDTEPDAEPVTFTMSCAVCEASGPTESDTSSAARWIPAHLKQEPEHLTYREHITRPYRAVPGPWL